MFNLKFIKMRNLIFGTLKVLEVATYLFFIYLLGLFFDWIGFSEWLDKFIDSLPEWLSALIGIILILIVILWIIGMFKEWIAKNWIWTDKIICSFKKRRQK